jgi:hypothetical protein
VIDFFDNNGLRRAPHPPYSPDLALRDFFLFGDIKEKLEVPSFDNNRITMARPQFRQCALLSRQPKL